MLNRST